MPQRLTSEDRLVRAAASLVEHKDRHGWSFTCVHCARRIDGLRMALDSYGVLNRVSRPAKESA